MMNRGPTNAEKLRAVPWIIGASSANSVFMQLTFMGSVFVLFLSELGLSKTQIGSVLSLFPFTGLIALFIAPTVARFGLKRTFLAFWFSRKLVAAFLLLTPWILSQFGSQVTVTYVIGVVAIFAVFGAVSVTALSPWEQEYIPNAVRGKFTATNSIFASLAALVAVTVAGYVMGPGPDVSRFMILFAIGVISGLLSAWAFSFVPGGAPIEGTGAARTSHRDLVEAIRDSVFVRYLAGVGLLTLAFGPLGSFLPLFMQEQVGLSSSNVVLLGNGTLLGGLLSSYLWGWAADRYGSRPVMLTGLLLLVLLPLCWWLMPRHTDWSLYAAMGIAFLRGVAGLGWGIGAGRLLFVSIVPPEKKTGYLALDYAAMGIIGGLSQQIGGRVLDLSAGITGQFLIFTLDSYTPLFIAGLTLPIMSILLLRGVRADSAVTVSEFAGMFLRGNPFKAMESLIRYHRAKDERAAVSMTARLGQTQSPLTVDELLDALADPRFNVRFEAIVSIGRRGPDTRLMEALIEIIGGSEPALSVVAAWALGRIGDKRALLPLRAGLDAHYRSVQVHCARSLGILGDTEVIPLLHSRLERETGHGLRMAYVAALGQLRAEEATGTLLDLLRASEDKDSQMELALALARIVGDEHHFIQLLRQVSLKSSSGTSQAVVALETDLGNLALDTADLMAAIEACAETLTREGLDRGVALMNRFIRLFPTKGLSETGTMILQDCAVRLDDSGARRIEYVILALHTMHVGLRELTKLRSDLRSRRRNRA